jgi:hypothetical protein
MRAHAHHAHRGGVKSSRPARRANDGEINRVASKYAAIGVKCQVLIHINSGGGIVKCRKLEEIEMAEAALIT